MKKSSLHSCNVLEVQPEGRQLWRFLADNGNLHSPWQQTIPFGQPLPPKVVSRDWRALWQKKLNIAWLSSSQIFLRVVHLPVCEHSELLSMIEFQLEKLSPLPVAQIFWSVEVLAHPVENLQTVIVVIAARDAVEEFLGRLEADGYLPDRLELPELHQLLNTPVEEDGLWIYLDLGGDAGLCLAAWWNRGTLQNLQLIHLPQGDERSRVLIDELTKMAWAGEVEGWWTHSLRLHLVAGPETATAWEQPLSAWAGAPVVIVSPLPKGVLAEVSARRCVRGESRANLLPAEVAVRYRQKFIDGLWMGGLGATVVVYIIGVIIYFGFLQVLGFQHNRLERQRSALSGSYTNALELKERISVLQEQLNLKYAALDCWKVASERLPPELTLTWLNFQRGRTLNLSGTHPADNTTPVTDYNQALRRETIDGQPVFSLVNAPRIYNRGGSGGWDFSCELARGTLE